MEQKQKYPQKENRAKWTDLQWADYLGVKKWEIEKIRQFLNANFVPFIEKGEFDKLWHFAINRRNDTSSGLYREIPFIFSDNGFVTTEECVEHARTEFIPSLKFNPFISSVHKIPPAALQMIEVENSKTR